MPNCARFKPCCRYGVSCEKLNPPRRAVELVAAVDRGLGAGLDAVGDVVRAADAGPAPVVGLLLGGGLLLDAPLVVGLVAGRVADDEDRAGGAVSSKLSPSNSKNPMVSRNMRAATHAHVVADNTAVAAGLTMKGARAEVCAIRYEATRDISLACVACRA